MKFDELDRKMRVYETSLDYCVLPHIFMVARLDGRNFTKLTKEKHSFQAPFDEVFRDYMIETVKHLMNCGFNVIYGYTESDEISLLFHSQENSFFRKLRKFNSVLAGEASAKFSVLLGDIACFDCRISQLPRKQDVIDYFRWRNEDAHRNSLNAYCYWKLRESGMGIKAATAKLEGLGVAEKNELLFQYGINFNELPNWQKRGIGVYWINYNKESINRARAKGRTLPAGTNRPLTNEVVYAKRRKIKIDQEIPKQDAYNQFILNIINDSEANSLNDR